MRNIELISTHLHFPAGRRFIVDLGGQEGCARRKLCTFNLSKTGRIVIDGRRSVCLPNEGRPMLVEQNRVWYPALKRVGIRERNPYQTRHTFATLALSAGEAIGWVAKQMGHTSTAMIIRHYYKFIPNLTRQDGSAFDKAAEQAGL